jgi:hypothetical protein
VGELPSRRARGKRSKKKERNPAVVYFRFQNPTLRQRILYFGFGGLDAMVNLWWQTTARSQLLQKMSLAGMLTPATQRVTHQAAISML